ncbi:MAG: ABC transporter substrate-binding protein [Anaerolineae bacterium CG2_30_64_16]|nr:MAG: ABC transporter substrate-binding protein [Anaerolineae bacterium CG2_30_64_16]
MKRWTIISLFLLVALVATACVQPAPPPTTAPPPPATEAPQATQPPAKEAVTIKVWFHSGKGEERDVLDAQVRDFNAMNTGVTVNAVELPEGSYNDQVQAAALAGDLPCLLDFDGPFLYNYAWSGYMRPIDKYVSTDLKADFLPSIIDQGTYAGQLYSLGAFDSGLAIWGNKAYLEKAGVRIPKSADDAWTFDEFNQALEKLQALDEVQYAIDFKFNYGAGEWFTYGFSPIVQGFGGDLINRKDYQSADGVLNGPEAVAAMKWFKGLFDKGYAISQPAGDDDFYGKKITALSYVGHWMWTPHHEGLGDDLVLLPMPVWTKRPATGMGSWNWGITSSCENPDAAWKFLEYLIEPDQILRMTNANGAVPARLSAIKKSDLYAANGPLNSFVQQLQNYAIPRPVTPAYPTITSEFSKVVSDIISGADVQETLDKAVKAIDQDIQDNQGYPAPTK